MKNVTKYEIMVREVFSGAIWSDLERLFSTDRRILMKEIKEFFNQFPDGDERLKKFNDQINKNAVEMYLKEISELHISEEFIER